MAFKVRQRERSEGWTVFNWYGPMDSVKARANIHWWAPTLCESVTMCVSYECIFYSNCRKVSPETVKSFSKILIATRICLPFLRLSLHCLIESTQPVARREVPCGSIEYCYICFLSLLPISLQNPVPFLNYSNKTSNYRDHHQTLYSPGFIKPSLADTHTHVGGKTELRRCFKCGTKWRALIN